MLQGYFVERMTGRAVFSLFVPPSRAAQHLLACGLEIRCSNSSKHSVGRARPSFASLGRFPIDFSTSPGFDSPEMSMQWPRGTRCSPASRSPDRSAIAERSSSKHGRINHLQTAGVRRASGCRRRPPGRRLRSSPDGRHDARERARPSPSPGVDATSNVAAADGTPSRSRNPGTQLYPGA